MDSLAPPHLVKTVAMNDGQATAPDAQIRLLRRRLHNAHLVIRWYQNALAVCSCPHADGCPSPLAGAGHPTPHIDGGT